MQEKVIWFISSLVLITNAQFKCEEKGRFLDRHSNCTQFIDCEVNSKNEFQMSRMSCPLDELYSVEEQRCVLASNLMCRLLTDGTFTSLPISIDFTTPSNPVDQYSSVSIINSDITFKCPSIGKYPSKGVGCRNYFDCQFQSRNISLKLNTCPASTVFDPKLLNCVPDSEYTCSTNDSLKGHFIS